MLLAAWLLAATCGGTSPNTVAIYPVYQFTCCVKEDVEQSWRPGHTVELHWIVRQGAPSVSNVPHAVTLVATIYGPYADMETLKKGGGATNAVQGSVVKTNDRTPKPVPVSTFILSPDLPPGYYNLTFTDDFGNGSSAGGAMVVRVGSG